jgi:hypothetical protein
MHVVSIMMPTFGGGRVERSGIRSLSSQKDRDDSGFPLGFLDNAEQICQRRGTISPPSP